MRRRRSRTPKHSSRPCRTASPASSSSPTGASFGECSKTLAKLRHEGRYTPPSVQGTLAYPSTAGGVEWGGGAVDPRSNVYVVNSSAVAQIYRLVPRARITTRSRKHDPDELLRAGRRPVRLPPAQLREPAGACPAGIRRTARCRPTISTRGKLLWRKPFGEVQKWGFYMPDSWGSVTIGAPLITKSGVIFIGGSMDARVRAIDLKSGDVLWKAQVDAPAVANPGDLRVQGTAIRRIRRRRQRDPEAAGFGRGRRLRAARSQRMTRQDVQKLAGSTSSAQRTRVARALGDRLAPARQERLQRLALHALDEHLSALEAARAAASAAAPAETPRRGRRRRAATARCSNAASRKRSTSARACASATSSATRDRGRQLRGLALATAVRRRIARSRARRARDKPDASGKSVCTITSPARSARPGAPGDLHQQRERAARWRGSRRCRARCRRRARRRA